MDTSHYETEKVWVDTSHLKIEGHWETNKTWVDTSHMVYQGYWKNFTEKVWVDTSYWVYGFRSEGTKKVTDINTNKNIARIRYITFLCIYTPYCK